MAFAGVAGPSGSVDPLGAVSGGVDVDADEDDVGFAVRGALAGGVKAVAVVDEDEHKNRELVVSLFPMRI